jgi:GNAT superfamily N-acetyltransferase
MIELRVAEESEANLLSELAYESKAYWGYSPEFMAACRDDLKISPRDCRSGHIVVACDGDKIAGFYYITGTTPKGELADLFVRSSYIGTGVGKILLEHAEQLAKQLGMESLEIHSDPNAKDFYIHMGAVEAGTIPSGSISGRVLPRLVLAIPS